MLDFMKNIGPSELIIIVLVIGAVFGTKKITDLAERFGESARELKKVKNELNNVKSEVSEVIGGAKLDV